MDHSRDQPWRAGPPQSSATTDNSVEAGDAGSARKQSNNYQLGKEHRRTARRSNTVLSRTLKAPVGMYMSEGM